MSPLLIAACVAAYAFIGVVTVILVKWFQPMFRKDNDVLDVFILVGWPMVLFTIGMVTVAVIVGRILDGIVSRGLACLIWLEKRGEKTK